MITYAHEHCHTCAWLGREAETETERCGASAVQVGDSGHWAKYEKDGA